MSRNEHWLDAHFRVWTNQFKRIKILVNALTAFWKLILKNTMQFVREIRRLTVPDRLLQTGSIYSGVEITGLLITQLHLMFKTATHEKGAKKHGIREA